MTVFVEPIANSTKKIKNNNNMKEKHNTKTKYAIVNKKIIRNFCFFLPEDIAQHQMNIGCNERVRH